MRGARTLQQSVGNPAVAAKHVAPTGLSVVHRLCVGINVHDSVDSGFYGHWTSQNIPILPLCVPKMLFHSTPSSTLFMTYQEQNVQKTSSSLSDNIVSIFEPQKMARMLAQHFGPKGQASCNLSMSPTYCIGLSLSPLYPCHTTGLHAKSTTPPSANHWHRQVARVGPLVEGKAEPMATHLGPQPSWLF